MHAAHRTQACGRETDAPRLRAPAPGVRLLGAGPYHFPEGLTTSRKAAAFLWEGERDLTSLCTSLPYQLGWQLEQACRLNQSPPSSVRS